MVESKTFQPPIEINSNLQKIASIFNYPLYNDDFFQFLSTQKSSIQQLCSKELINQGAWSCLDCEMDETSIICGECYLLSKEKHKGHRLIYKANTIGCCDCGNPESWKPSGFCSLHKGLFCTDGEVDQYIKDSFKSETIINELEKEFDLIFCEITEWLNLLNQEHEIVSPTYDIMFTYMIKEISIICKYNPAIVHILSKVLLKQPKDSLTQHKCFYINANDYSFNYIDSSSEETHKCICNYICILMRNFRETTISHQFLLYFIQNFKMNKVIGLLLFLLQPLMTNEILNMFSVQVLKTEVSEIIANNENYLTNFFENLYTFTTNALQGSNFKYKNLNKMFDSVYYVILYLTKNETIHKFAKKKIIYTKLIDIMYLFHNHNSIIEENLFFKREGYKTDFMTSEFNLIIIFMFVVSYKSFNKENENEDKEILLYLISKINEKHDTNNLNFDEYSFHITLYRALSVYITRFAFAKTVHEGIDFYESIIYLIKDIPNHEDTFTLIYNNMFKYIGFVKSTELGYWNHYGENMGNYSHIFSKSFINKTDLCLIKILHSLSLPNVSTNLFDILKLAEVKSSYQVIENIKTNLNENSDDVEYYETIERDLTFNARVLDVYLKSLRENFCFFSLLIFSNQYFQYFKIYDDVLSNVALKEKQNIISIVKEILVSKIIVEGNLITYSKIKSLLEHNKSILEILGEQLFQQIIDEITICKKGKVRQCSIKDELLVKYDSCLIFSPHEESKAQQYIINFKSKEINVLNVAEFTYLNCLMSLQNKSFISVFNKQNMQVLSQLLCFSLSNEKYTSIFIHTLSKYILFMCSIKKNFTSEVNEYFINKIRDIVSYLQQTKIKDIFIKDVCVYVCQEINKIQNIGNITSLNMLTNNDDKESKSKKSSNNKGKMKALMNKMKKQFQTKNTNIINTYLDEINESSNTDDKEVRCVICRCVINVNEEPHGKFGYFIYDTIQFKMIYNSLKKIYKKHTNKDDFDSIYQNTHKQKSFRLYTCNHLTHFSCFENLLVQNLSLIRCPLCKVISNTYIPIITDNNYSFNKIVGIIYFIETILSNNISPTSLINDVKEETFIQIFSQIMMSYLLFLISKNCGDDNFKSNQLYLIGSIIRAIRTLLKAGILKEEIFNEIFNNKIEEIKQGKEIKMLNNNDKEVIIIGEVLFLSLVLDKFSKKDENKILNLLYPYISVIYYINELYFSTNELKYDETLFKMKLNYNDMLKHLSMQFTLPNNNDIIIDDNKKQNAQIFILSILTMIHYMKEIVNIIITPESYISYPPIQMHITTEYYLYNDYLNSLTLPSLQTMYNSIMDNLHLEIQSLNSQIIPFQLFTIANLHCIAFNLITLPKNAQLLFEVISEKPCFVCSKYTSTYILCLLCGQQTCSSMSCQVTHNNQSIRNIFYHVEQCSGGNGIIAFSSRNQVYIITQRLFTQTNYDLFTNKFGDAPSGTEITDEYVLNEVNCQKAMQLFITRESVTHDL